MNDRLNIIVFGASGFTGKYAVLQTYKFAKDRDLTWGIAGRSKQRLETVLSECAKEVENDSIKSTPIVLADVNDVHSIAKMTNAACVIINCCGPYRLYGEIVVKSCIETGTHLLDVSGEIDYIGETYLKYSTRAAEKGVYIVSACGLDCVPTDLGVAFLENKFGGVLNSVEIYAHVSGFQEEGFSSRPQINFGTWESCIRLMGNLRNSFKTLKQLYDLPLPKLTPKLPLRFPVHKSPAGRWAVPFVAADSDVIKRSQIYFYQTEKRRPVQSSIYFELDSLFVLFLISFFGFFVFILAQFEFGRNLLLKYPSFFSGGLFSRDPPIPQDVENTRYEAMFYGNGWDSQGAAETPEQLARPPQKNVVSRIKINNPGYGFTAAAVVLCAVMLLTEKDSLPKKGGVYTTAAAFAKTSLIEELQKNGYVFEIVHGTCSLKG